MRRYELLVFHGGPEVFGDVSDYRFGVVLYSLWFAGVESDGDDAGDRETELYTGDGGRDIKSLTDREEALPPLEKLRLFGRLCVNRFLGKASGIAPGSLSCSSQVS